MKKIIALSVSMLLFSMAHSQALFPYLAKTDNNTEVPIIFKNADTPFIRVLTRFFMNDKGEINNINITKIECSICTDSLIEDAKMRSIEYVKTQQYPPAKQSGKPVGVYFTLPVVFKY